MFPLKKTVFSMLCVALVLSIVVVGSNVDAASGEGAVRTSTLDTYYGISADFYVPSNVYVPNDGSYVAFYVGLGNQCEGGISYNGQWNHFINCGSGSSNESDPIPTQPSAGDKINIKLVNNLDDTATLYVYYGNYGKVYRNIPVSNGSLTRPTTVKMVHSNYDVQDKVRYSNAYFKNVIVRNSNGTYSPFPTSNSKYDFDRVWNAEDYSVPNENPLKTYLVTGN